jgi:hypothetical protein
MMATGKGIWKICKAVLVFHVEHSMSDRCQVLHTIFHAAEQAGIVRIEAILNELFHVEQATYPRSCTNLRRCQASATTISSIFEG